MFSKMIGTALLFSTVGGCAFFNQPDHYQVAASAYSEGQLLGESALTLAAGELSSVLVDGENGYELALEIIPLADDSVTVSASLKTATGQMTPTFSTVFGKLATVQAGDLELRVLVHQADD